MLNCGYDDHNVHSFKTNDFVYTIFLAIEKCRILCKPAHTKTFLHYYSLHI